MTSRFHAPEEDTRAVVLNPDRPGPEYAVQMGVIGAGLTMFALMSFTLNAGVLRVLWDGPVARFLLKHLALRFYGSTKSCRPIFASVRTGPGQHRGTADAGVIMNAPRLSLVMGGSTAPAEGGDVALPVPEGGTVHLHLHLGGTVSPATEAVRRSLGGWGALTFGIGLVAAFAGGYQLGHRSPPDDVSNLRPVPALSGLGPPEPAMPGVPALGLPVALPPEMPSI